MLIRIVDSQILNADIAERFSFGNATRSEGTEPLWYFALHWMNKGGTVIALRDQSTEGGKAILDFIMAAGEADKKCVDLSPFLLTREEEADLIRELQSVKRRIRSGDVVDAELVN